MAVGLYRFSPHISHVLGLSLDNYMILIHSIEISCINLYPQIMLNFRTNYINTKMKNSILYNNFKTN